MTTSPHKLSLAILSLTWLLPSISELNATDLWVGSAPEGTPYPSIQAALDDAGPGDVVRVVPGIYRERVSFQNSGTSDQPVTLQGDGPGVVIDGSSPVELVWEPAPEIGSGVYRAPLDFFPFTVTANGQTITTLDENRTDDEDASHAPLNLKPIYWPDAFVNGIGPSGWSGVKALAMYRHKEKELLVRFQDELDPRAMIITVAPKEPVVNTNGQNHCVVRNLTLRNAAIGVLIDGSTEAVVERCQIDPADYGVRLDNGAKDCTVRFNRISLSPYAGSDTYAAGSWDNWQAMKIGGFYDRIGISIRQTIGGHDIHDNYIHDHWDGIDDHGNPPWGPQADDPRDNTGLNVHHNLIRDLTDDGMETMGPGIDGQWHDNIVIRAICAFRIKAPRRGPLFIYRNIFLDNKEDLRNWGQGTQFYPEAEVWVYHNTSTSNTAVTMNYHNLKMPLTTPDYHYLNNLFWCRGWTRSSDAVPLPDWQTDGNVFILATKDFPRPWDAERDRYSEDKIEKTWNQAMAQAAEAGRELNSTWVGYGPAGFVDPETYDMSLREDSPARQRGQDPVLVADRELPGCSGDYFTGITPDAGALQYGQDMPEIPRFDFAAAGMSMPKGGRERVVLVGDSTVTGKKKDADQAGWGWAIEHWITPRIRVINTAVGGRSSRSFRSEGRWDKAMALQPDWVLIQFGHNDQKGKGPERESAAETDYRDHLRRYVSEAREHGAKPILVTPVCRRTYHSDGSLNDSLEPYAESVRIVAEEMDVPILDLHQYSYEQFSQMTAEESLAFSPTANKSDRTHFSTAASFIVAEWVLTLMQQEVPELAAGFEPTMP